MARTDGETKLFRSRPGLPGQRMGKHLLENVFVNAISNWLRPIPGKSCKKKTTKPRNNNFWEKTGAEFCSQYHSIGPENHSAVSAVRYFPGVKRKSFISFWYKRECRIWLPRSSEARFIVECDSIEVPKNTVMPGTDSALRRVAVGRSGATKTASAVTVVSIRNLHFVNLNFTT